MTPTDVLTALRGKRARTIPEGLDAEGVAAFIMDLPGVVARDTLPKLDPTKVRDFLAGDEVEVLCTTLSVLRIIASEDSRVLCGKIAKRRLKRWDGACAAATAAADLKEISTPQPETFPTATPEESWIEAAFIDTVALLPEVEVGASNEAVAAIAKDAKPLCVKCSCNYARDGEETCHSCRRRTAKGYPVEEWVESAFDSDSPGTGKGTASTACDDDPFDTAIEPVTTTPQAPSWPKRGPEDQLKPVTPEPTPTPTPKVAKKAKKVEPHRVCTRCGHTGPTEADFGYRNMRRVRGPKGARVEIIEVRDQPQCRPCRSTAAKASSARKLEAKALAEWSRLPETHPDLFAKVWVNEVDGARTFHAQGVDGLETPFDTAREALKAAKVVLKAALKAEPEPKVPGAVVHSLPGLIPVETIPVETLPETQVAVATTAETTAAVLDRLANEVPVGVVAEKSAHTASTLIRAVVKVVGAKARGLLNDTAFMAEILKRVSIVPDDYIAAKVKAAIDAADAADVADAAEGA